MEISYRQLLSFCISTLAESEDKSDENINKVVQQFQTFENWDGPSLVRDIKSNFAVQIGSGAVLVDSGHQPWLEGKKAQIDAFYWDRYRQYLQKSGYHPLPLAEIDKSTDRILGLMDDPTRPGPWDRRGMVLGHVQSGKTSNYVGLINKAADAGYKVIIVIAGIHNNLRNQTQRRIDEGFRGVASADIKKSAAHHYVGVGEICPDRSPSSFTTTLRDFNRAAAQQVGIPMSNLTEPAVFVIKKNASTLGALIKWLRQYSGVGPDQRIEEPLLLIDDEADNASINTSTNPNNVTRINSQIRELLQTFTRSAYVGYTATPFANIFVNPDTDDEMLGDDLFPRDFIVSLDAPSDYFGPHRIFDGSEDSPYVREVVDIDDYIPTKHSSNFAPDVLPPSLEEAIRAFILTRAIRIKRGQGNQHSSMLVNISHLNKPQRGTERLIRSYLDIIRNQIRLYGHHSIEQREKYQQIQLLHRTFENEFVNSTTSWPEVYAVLWDAIAPITIVTINGKSPDTLNYEQHKESGLHVIAVGGYSLSRGLTLEGLSTSYLSRNSKQYDTLMQMGRWFGYRPGYEDLCRLWLPPVVISWFEHITTATEELRSDLLQMQQVGATPRDFGLRVRTHPEALLVTARNKMGTGEKITAKLSLTRMFLETPRLLSTSDALQRNREAARDFTHALVSHPQVRREADKSGTAVFGNVPADVILAFLSRWANLPASYLTAPEQLVEFISSRSDSLGIWDVALPGVISTTNLETSEYSAIPIRMQQRTLGDEDTRKEIRIGSKLRIMSPSDEAIGLSMNELEQARASATKRGMSLQQYIPGTDVRKVRTRPLFLLHYLDLRKKDGTRAFEDPVIGWSISLPGQTDPGEPIEYLVNKTYLDELHLFDQYDESFDEDL